MKGQAQESRLKQTSHPGLVWRSLLSRNRSRTSSFPWAVLKVRVLLNVKTRACVQDCCGPLNFSMTGQTETGQMCLQIAPQKCVEARSPLVRVLKLTHIGLRP